MTIIELKELFEEYFSDIAPNGKCVVSDEGEIVFYTNLCENEEGELEEFEDMDEEFLDEEEDGFERLEESEDE
jgi:hypothetical protein